MQRQDANPRLTHALAAVAYLRSELKSRNASHVARVLGVGGATGLGSIVYALTAMSRLMSDDDLLADAHRAAMLLTDDLIASDKRLDIVGGSAGAILSLLALYADTGADDVLKRALVCAEHLARRGSCRLSGDVARRRGLCLCNGIRGDGDRP